MRPSELILTDRIDYAEVALKAGATAFFLSEDLSAYLETLDHKNVVIVEKNGWNLLSRTVALWRNSNTVTSFETADEALREIPKIELPVDVVISTVMFESGVDGLTLIRQLSNKVI